MLSEKSVRTNTSKFDYVIYSNKGWLNVIPMIGSVGFVAQWSICYFMNIARFDILSVFVFFCLLHT